MGLLTRSKAVRGLVFGAAWVLLVTLSPPLDRGGASRALAQGAPAIAVIIGRSSRISNIDSGVLRTVFLNLPATYQGERLIAFNLPTASAVRIRFDLAVLGLTSERVGMYWVDQRVRDGRRPPRAAPSAELAVRVVESLRGAISYVPSALAGSAAVRILRVDGKSPGDSGYLLE